MNSDLSEVIAVNEYRSKFRHVQLSFIHGYAKSTGTPLLQRLDGIYFNSDQEWKSFK